MGVAVRPGLMGSCNLNGLIVSHLSQKAFRMFFILVSKRTMARTFNILQTFLFAMIVGLCALFLTPSASEAHSLHKSPTIFDGTTVDHKSCPLIHHPVTEPCPGAHYSGNPRIAKECGGTPSGKVPAPGPGFSKETVVHARPHGFQPALEAQDLFAFLPPYQSFILDPFERPPQSV